ncbi:MAG: hypothetical protein ACTSUO_00150 [Candidatus Thorarchaeota archaeon]
MSMEYSFQVLLPTKRTLAISQKIANYCREKGLNREQCLRVVTTFVHRTIKYEPDYVAFKTLEYFATPDTTLEKGVDDCEGYAFLITAILNGLPNEYKPDEARAVIGKYTQIPWLFPGLPPKRGYHAWSEARIGDKWFILDGTNGLTREVILPQDPHYIPMLGIYPDKLLIFSATW